MLDWHRRRFWPVNPPVILAYYWRAIRDGKAADCALYGAADPSCSQARDAADQAELYLIHASLLIGFCLAVDCLCP